jgi:predicted nucleic acid-binding protein
MSVFRALDAFFEMEFEVIWAEELYRHAWFVAHEHRIPSISDALYVALADLHSTPVWTADLKLVRTIADERLVRWIGDYEG